MRPLSAQEPLWLEAVLGGDLPQRTEHGVAWFTSSPLAPAASGAAVQLSAGEWIQAPLALPVRGFPHPWHAGFDLELEGTGTLVARIVDASGSCAEARYLLSASGARAIERQAIDRVPTPRAHLRLEVEHGVIVVRRIGLALAWPEVSAAEFRAQVDREWEFVYAALAAARDRDGERHTSFLCQRVDPQSGVRLRGVPALHHPYFDALLQAQLRAPRSEWAEVLSAYFDDLWQLAWNEATGLPELWDGERDHALSARAIDPRGALQFAIEWMRTERLTQPRAEAVKARLLRAAQTLRAGQAPDGSWPAVYVPATGAPASEAPQIRALRSARLVAELECAAGVVPDMSAALDCLQALEIAWHWPGTPERPDPGFDDAFGLLGADAFALYQLTGEKAFGRFFREAASHYATLWQQAREVGGSNAPDQVRAMLLLLDSAVGEEERTSRLRLAMNSFRDLARSTQLKDGRFADLTAVHFEPRLHLPVGDLPGVPFHLLRLGARLLHEEQLGPHVHAELRAILAQALWALEPFRGSHGFGKGETGAADTARLFQVLTELRLAL